MVEMAECKACCAGVLLPFQSPQGFVVYFCNNCRSRFSGYASEPCSDGSPIFAFSAEYTEAYAERAGTPLPESALMEKYRNLLDANPPVEARGEDQSEPSLPGDPGSLV
jgi:hypothetical protein